MRATALTAVFIGTLLGTVVATPAVAQTSVASSDIQRLQDTVYDLGGEISRLRTRDARLAGELQNDLDDLRDEVVYLRVKLRREGSVPRAEYAEIRDRLETVRSRARGETTSSTAPARDGYGAGGGGSSTAPAAAASGTTPSASRTSTTPAAASSIPVGQEIDVRLQDTLSSDTNRVEDRFIATTLVDLQVDERMLIPAGSEVRGVVSSVNSAGRLDRKGSLTVTFDQITIDGRAYPMRGTVTEAIESSGIRGDAGRIGAGAGVGAIIGGILGGFKGALTGILIGGGGVIAATEGKDVVLPPGTILRVRLDSPPAVR